MSRPLQSPQDAYEPAEPEKWPRQATQAQTLLRAEAYRYEGHGIEARKWTPEGTPAEAQAVAKSRLAKNLAIFRILVMNRTPISTQNQH